MNRPVGYIGPRQYFRLLVCPSLAALFLDLAEDIECLFELPLATFPVLAESGYRFDTARKRGSTLREQPCFERGDLL